MKQCHILTIKAQINGGQISARPRRMGGKRQLMHCDRPSGTPLERLRPQAAEGRGPFSGQHARYVLRSLITILEEEGGKS